jgi:predicted type IV restriction endonuclease
LHQTTAASAITSSSVSKSGLGSPSNHASTSAIVPNRTKADEAPQSNGVVTTSEETEAFYIIRAILREKVPVKRIVLRDVQSYCGVLLDDNNRKPICRFWFNASQKYIGFFDTATDNKEERIPITHIDDVFKYADRFKATVARYGTKPIVQKARMVAVALNAVLGSLPLIWGCVLLDIAASDCD